MIFILDIVQILEKLILEVYLVLEVNLEIVILDLVLNFKDFQIVEYILQII